MPSMYLQVADLPAPEFAYSNKVYVNKRTFDQLVAWNGKRDYSIKDVMIGQCVFKLEVHEFIKVSDIGMNLQQRRSSKISISDMVFVSPITAAVDLTTMTVGVDLFIHPGKQLELEAGELAKAYHLQFQNQVFCVGQYVAMKFNGNELNLCIKSLDHGIAKGSLVGKVVQDTVLTFDAMGTESVLIVKQKGEQLSGNGWYAFMLCLFAWIRGLFLW
jgi:hypothetical protein